MRTFLLSCILLGALAAAEPAPTLFRQPALNKTHLVFSYAGDLWIVPRAGGEAVRLTSSPGLEGDPYFSPDGESIAFSGEYDGNRDVFIVPAKGGVPRRLTYHPDADVPCGWSRDGKKVLITSPRGSYSRFGRLFLMPVDGVFPEALALPIAHEGSFSPDGTRIAYVPLRQAFAGWKRYRGGRTTPIWIARLSDSQIERVPRENSNDFNPIWIGQSVYFLSDRNGAITLFSYDVNSHKVEQVLPNTGFDLKWASAFGDTIAYEQFGAIYLFDIKTRKSHRVDIKLSGDFQELRPRVERVGNLIRSAAISPTGARAVLEARGDIFTVPAEKGDVRNLTATPGVAERDPSWSPDGKSIAYFSDASGEYELHVRDQAGAGPVKTYKLGDPSRFYYSPTWSPDSKKIAFTAKDLTINYIDLESGKVTQVDKDRYSGARTVSRLVWSPDSQWLSYTRQLRSTLRAVFVYSLATKEKHQVTDGMSDATLPLFDRDGKYLYFAASTNVGLNVGWRDMSAFQRPVTASIYAVVLRKDLPSPVLPESDDETEKPKENEKPAAKVEVKIDFENIAQRIVALPIPAHNYTDLQAGKAGILFLIESPFDGGGNVLHKFDLKKRKTDRILDGFNWFDVSANGEKMLYRKQGRGFIAPAGEAPKPDLAALKLDNLEVRVDPRAEWSQMFREAWRIQRDFFYDPNLHGLNLKQMMARYEPFLAAVASSGDLNYLFTEMMGEFTASHLYVDGGDRPEVRRVRGGLLGADYTIENGRYRFAHIFDGENWNPDLRAPLTQPGVNVKVGEYLLTVNGRDLKAADNLYSYFEATAGKQVMIRVGPDPAGKDARDITVVPVESESRLRNLEWVENNRRQVDKMSGGRLAYVYLPDTSLGGYTNFNRYYFAQVGAEGAVIDERFNSGGAQPDYIIDYLRRPLMHWRTMREGEEVQGPLAGIFGPKAMLINEYAGSGGDSIAWYFRAAGVGPLVGKRTWGGLVGGLGGYPQLVDGGSVTAPSVAFWDAKTGEWVAENIGVAPDYDVEMDPQAVREGKDPQLEKAVALLLESLEKTPPVKRTHPPYPNYHQK